MKRSGRPAAKVKRGARDGSPASGSAETLARALRQVDQAASGFGVFTTERTGRVVTWNAIAEQLFGYRAEQIIGRRVSRLYRAVQAADGDTADACAQALATGRFEGEASCRRRDGTMFRASLIVTAIRDAAGRHCGFGWLAREIGSVEGEQEKGEREKGEQAKGERELRARFAAEMAGARAAALESSRLKAAFLANMSHEFRTPLNIILGYNELIAEHLIEMHDSSQAECLDAVARACKRLLGTLNAVLDYSKFESRSYQLKRQQFEVAGSIRELIAEAMPQAAEKGLTVGFECGDEAATITFDKHCMTQALRNLIDNAIKFTHRGGVTVRLERDERGELCVSVADTGIGIDVAFQAHLLEPFSQEDSGITRRYEGAGLGLALTRRYLELNDARLSVRSEKGVGSRFTIHFSASTTAPVAGDAMGAQAAAVAERERAGGHPTVLVVEDDRDNQNLMRAMMKSRYQMLSAATPTEVRRQIENYRGPIHLVLMDLGLRGSEDGLALTRSLRGLERFRTTPIVAMTGHAMSVNREQARAAGCDDFLVKPVERARLLAAIERLLRRARASGRVEGPAAS